VAQAFAPSLVGICLDAFDAKALCLSSSLGVTAIMMLFVIRQEHGLEANSLS
jgi:hypothetical protein